MELCVLKVGGALLADREKSAKIYGFISRLARKRKILLVVSAIGRDPDPYSTDGLDSSVSGYLTLKERDRLKSLGETYAVLKVVGDLRREGIKTCSLSCPELGLRRVKKVFVLDRKRIWRLLDKWQILVVPGFITVDSNGEPIALPREGSDYSACIIADKLGISDVFLFKDISGIYDRFGYVHHSISYDEFFQLTEGFTSPISFQGTKYSLAHHLVLHLLNSDGLEVAKLDDSR